MQDNAQWHNLRAQNIGGSEVADLFNQGFNSYFHLWHLKAGNIEPPDLSNDEWIMSGNFLEQGIMDWAQWKWNLRYKNPVAYYQHQKIKGMACTPDGLNQDDPTDMCQIKNIDGMIFGKQWESDDDQITHAPMKYILQCQHEMACSGCETSSLIACVGGKTLKKMVVFRDNGLIEIIEDAVEKFWRSIEIGDEPNPDYKLDGPVLQELRKREVIRPEPIDWSENNQMRSVAFEYLDAAKKEKEGKESKDAAKAQIMHNATGGKKFLFGEQSGDPRITIVTNKYGSSYPKVTVKS